MQGKEAAILIIFDMNAIPVFFGLDLDTYST
jgi:hypothetical protein